MPTRNFEVPRPELDSPLWQSAPLWRLWCWCRARAARKTRPTSRDGVPVPLAPGQLAATVRELVQGTGLGQEELRQALCLGQKLGLLRVRRAPWGLRIEIVN
jgi:hypothetical protein